jgi:hypothetical protein
VSGVSAHETEWLGRGRENFWVILGSPDSASPTKRITFTTGTGSTSGFSIGKFVLKLLYFVGARSFFMSSNPTASQPTLIVTKSEGAQAVNGNIVVTLTAHAVGSPQLSQQILFQLDLYNAESLSGMLEAAIVLARAQNRGP